MKLEIDKIYCCHHPSDSLKERKGKLVSLFATENLEVEWVEGFPPSEAIKWEHGSLLKMVMTMGPIGYRSEVSKAEELCGRLLSLILKHNYCCKDQVEKGYENVLILEDDVDLFSNFNEDYFNGCMREFKTQNLEMMFMGTCCDLEFPYRNQNQRVYSHPDLTSRCTHCYVLNIEGAKKVLKHCYKMINAADWQYNWIIKEERIKNAWVEPGVRQLGYQSSLSNH